MAQSQQCSETWWLMKIGSTYDEVLNKLGSTFKVGLAQNVNFLMNEDISEANRSIARTGSFKTGKLRL